MITTPQCVDKTQWTHRQCLLKWIRPLIPLSSGPCSPRWRWTLRCPSWQQQLSGTLPPGVAGYDTHKPLPPLKGPCLQLSYRLDIFGPYRSSRNTTINRQKRLTFTPINTFTSIYSQGDAILFYANYVIHKHTPELKAGSDWWKPNCSCHGTSHQWPMTERDLPWSDSTSTIRSLRVIWINRAPCLYKGNRSNGESDSSDGHYLLVYIITVIKSSDRNKLNLNVKIFTYAKIKFSVNMWNFCHLIIEF